MELCLRVYPKISGFFLLAYLIFVHGELVKIFGAWGNSVDFRALYWDNLWEIQYLSLVILQDFEMTHTFKKNLYKGD